MCSDLDSVPPIFTSPLTQAPGRKITLKSTDGTEFFCFVASPLRSTGAGVVVLPDNRGLYNFYEQLTLRLAERGHVAIAIDYFGRSAGTEVRGKEFPFMTHLMQLTRQGLDYDIETASKFLRSSEGGNCGTTFALGFCFGGRQAFFASASHFGFDGVIGFYGAPSYYPNGAAGPAQRAHELAAPLLGIFGGADHGIPSADVEAFDRALVSAGVQHEFVTYANAPHSFFDVKYGEYQSECADAWTRICEFIDSQSSTSAKVTG